MLKQFDVVQIVTTKRIKYLSGPAGQAATPNGNWTIIGFVDSEALLSKDQTLCRVPIIDIREVGSIRDPQTLWEEIRKAGYITEQNINMPDYISQNTGVEINLVKKLLLNYNFKIEVTSVQERDEIFKRIKPMLEGKQ